MTKILTANKNKRSHDLCRRCGNRSLHKSHKTCSSCWFGKTKKLKTTNNYRINYFKNKYKRRANKRSCPRLPL